MNKNNFNDPDGKGVLPGGTIPPSRSPHRVYADFTGADPRFRDEEPESGPVPETVIFPDSDYPDGNPKTAMGAKKPDLTCIPSTALLHLATGMMNGEQKYGLYNWREKPISVRPYVAAGLRHLLAYLDGEDYSPDTVAAGKPVHHLAHVMATCSILLDAMELGVLNDNRGAPGKAGQMIEDYNQNGGFTPPS